MTKEEQKEYIKAWKAVNRARYNAKKDEWNKRNKQKVIAKSKVATALKSGRLKKPATCSKCQGGGKIEGHHPDYSKPLKVMWLCHQCHHQEHIDQRKRKRNGQLQQSARQIRPESNSAGL